MLSTSERLAGKLKQAFKDAGLSQVAVAGACGVTKQAVQGWIKNGRVDKKHLLKIAQITGRELSWWLATDLVDSQLPTEKLLDVFDDWRLKASANSLKTIELLTVLAQKNRIREEDWLLIHQLAHRLAAK